MVIDKTGFSAFLREQRHGLTPHEVGLPSTAHRRTPGLRRQEVAQLAGISIDYYIKLEQGRGATPSAQVLSALARALLLTQDERDYLFHLAGDTAPHSTGPSTSVSSSVRFLIENMPEVPAYVVDAAWNVLAWNDLAEYFIGELTRMPPLTGTSPDGCFEPQLTTPTGPLRPRTRSRRSSPRTFGRLSSGTRTSLRSTF